MDASSSLPQQIIKTIAYFNLFDYPLTHFEVWKWLWAEGGSSVAYEEVERALDECAGPEREVVPCGAFLVRRGREHIIAERLERHRLSIAKVDRARWVARLFSVIPWVEGMALCNSLGYRNSRASGDIDFFIVATPGTLWLTRFLTTALAALLRLRPTPTQTQDKVCLSFFVTRDHLNLESLQKPGGDVYLTYWVTVLIPLYGRGDLWREFYDANGWVRSRLPNTLTLGPGPTWLYRSGRERRHLPGAAVRVLDRLLERWQRHHLPVRLRELAARGTTEVVLDDQMLKFHDHDRREEYQQQWVESQRDLGAIFF